MKKIGQAEWEIMKFVTENHPVTVREVAAHMAANRNLARTTVITVLERLRGKRHLTRRKQGGVYHYSPRLEKGEVMKQVVDDFVENTLHGTLQPFVTWLSGKPDVSSAELRELRKVISLLEEQSSSAVPQDDSDV